MVWDDIICKIVMCYGISLYRSKCFLKLQTFFIRMCRVFGKLLWNDKHEMNRSKNIKNYIDCFPSFYSVDILGYTKNNNKTKKLSMP